MVSAHSFTPTPSALQRFYGNRPPFSVDAVRQPFRLQRMSKITSQSCFTGAALKGQGRIYETWFFALLAPALLLGSSSVRADGPDDEYMQIYNLIQQADTLATSGKPTSAKAKYQEAQTALKSFQKDYPEWNVKLVAYRLNYEVRKLVALTQ